MADKTKLLNLAQKHLTKGNLDKAIKAFQDLVALDPRDYRLSLRLADLLARAGRKKEAIEQYEKVAKVYVKDDFTPRAIAVYKTILRLDPELLSTYEKLSELYKSQGLEAEALSNLENLFSLYEKKKDENKQVEVLRIMVDMDPENLGFQVRLGEMLAKKGRKQEAAEAFAKAASTLSRRGFHDRASALFEKITALDPGNMAVRKELCAHYLESGKYPQAKREVEAILSASPDDPNMTLLLGRIQFQLGDREQAEANVSRSISLFKESGKFESVVREFLFVAQTHLKNGELNEAEVFYSNICKAAPRETRALKGLAALAETRGDRNSQVRYLFELGRCQAEAGEVRGAQESLKSVLVLDPGNAEADALLQQLAQGEAIEAPPLTEEKAAEDIKAIEEIEQIEELGAELLAEGEDLQEISEVSEEEIQETESLEDLARAASGGQPELDESIPEIELEDFEQEAVQVEAVGMEAPDESALEALEEPQPAEALKAATAELSLEDILVEIDVYQRYGLTDKVRELLDGARDRFGADPRFIEKEASLLEAEKAPEPAIMAFEEPTPSVPEAPERPSGRISPPLEDKAAGRPAQKAGDPFAEDMEEAEFYLSQGLDEEAVRIYESVLRRSPGHPAASAALGRIQGPKAAPIQEQPAPFDRAAQDVDDIASAGEVRSRLIVEDSVQADVGDFLDLADELRTELAEELTAPAAPEAAGEGPVTFEEIFAEFKKGIEETLGEQEYETHYNLGIAYKDMGLYDDAIREFEISSRDPKLLQDSLSLMAVCFLEKHDHSSSVKVLHKALEGAGEMGRTGLLFQLGEVYARMSDWGQAIEYYQQVRERDPSFERIDDVIAKAQKLMAAQAKGKAVKSAPESAMDDMLADLIREVEEMAQESSSSRDPEPGGKSKKDRISYL